MTRCYLQNFIDFNSPKVNGSRNNPLLVASLEKASSFGKAILLKTKLKNNH